VSDYEGDDPAAFVVSLNLHRRHLSESQRGMVAAKLANMVVGGAEANSANLQSCQPVSQADADEMLNVSTRTVAAAAKVRSEAPDELVRAVEQGTVSVSLASQVVALPDDHCDLIKYATEIRVRAQRKAGEMLAQTEKSEGAKGIGTSAVDSNDRTPTLADMGITKDQSSNWQALASMSEQHFEAAVATAKDTAGEVTKAFMLRDARGGPGGVPNNKPPARQDQR